MAKKSVIQRQIKRLNLIIKFFEKRKTLKNIISNNKIDYKDRWLAMIKLQLLPRDSSLIRSRNRCWKTGRARGVLKKFGLSRIKLREAAILGEIPGFKKSSW